MKKIIPGLMVILCIQLLFAVHVPDFKLRDTENKQRSYAQLKGKKVTVIDFWATWCKPCIRSIPKLVDLYEKYADRGVQIIGISVDSPRNVQKVKPFARSMGITYPVLLDINSQVMADLNVTLLPTLLIVDENDEIRIFHQGYRPGDEIFISDELEKILNKTDGDDKN